MTIYWARVRYTLTGNESLLEYRSEIAREMALSLLAQYVDVLSVGTNYLLAPGSVTVYKDARGTVH